MGFKENRKRRLASSDIEQAILKALEPFMQRVEDCDYASPIIQKLEDVAAVTAAFLAENEDLP